MINVCDMVAAIAAQDCHWSDDMTQRPSAEQVHDRMTEQVYPRALQSFKTDMVPTPVFTVPIMEQGAAALEQINEVWDHTWTLQLSLYCAAALAWLTAVAINH